MSRCVWAKRVASKDDPGPSYTGVAVWHRFVVAFALVAVATVPASAAPTPAPRVAGGTSVQRALLRQILHGLEPARIRAIRIGPPARIWRPFPRKAVELFVSVPRRDLRAEWQAWPLGGAFHDRSRALRLPPAVALQLTVVGELRKEGFRLGQSEQAPPPRATPAAARALEQKLRGAAGEAGARIDALLVSAPDGVAGAIRLRVSDPAPFLAKRAPGFVAAFSSRIKRDDGIYVIAVDDGGRFVWALAQATRVSTIKERIRADLVGCDPLPPLGNTTNSEPPPCPA